MLSSSDLKFLLDPYIGVQSLKDRWRKFISDRGGKGTHAEMELLGREIVEKNKIPTSIIRALFFRSKWTPDSKSIRKELESYEKKIKTSCPSFLSLRDQFIFSDDTLLNEIESRVYHSDYPFGPTNNDSGPPSPNGWCHEKTQDEENGKYHHGLFRCECFTPLDEEGFYCQGCKKFVQWKELCVEEDEKVIRLPEVGEGLGGWKEFFCSIECFFLSEKKVDPLQNILLELASSSMEYQSTE